MKRCKRCVLPSTWPNAGLDKSDKCNVCVQDEIKQNVDWKAREKKFKKILAKAKKDSNGGYDCIAPVSFGKDSTYILYILKRYGLNPLAVSFDHKWFTPVILRNREKVCEKLGIDYIVISPNYKTVKKLVKKSIKLLGDACWHCHAGVGSTPFRIAVQMKIPLIVWGEPSCEHGLGSYETESVHDYKSFLTEFVKGYPAEKMVDKNISMAELQPYLFPKEKDLKRVGVKGIFLGDYFKWNIGKQVQLIKDKFDWEGGCCEGSFEDFNCIECKYCGVHDYGAFIKKGFGRSTVLASIAIREDRMTRKQGLKVLKQYDGKRPHSLTAFLNEIKMTEKEFMKLHEKHKVK